MAKNRKKLKKFTNQLLEAQYLEIDDAIINVVNKKTKNVVVSIDIFSDYEKDVPYEEEFEDDTGEFIQTIDNGEDETTSTYKPMIVVNEEITETTKTPAIDEATGEQMYDRDNNPLYNVEEEVTVQEVVIDTAQVTTESIYIPPSTTVGQGSVFTNTMSGIEPGSWYYIKLQLEQSFKINEIKKAIAEFEKLAPAVIGFPVQTGESGGDPIYYTLQEVLEAHRTAIAKNPNTFWQEGDILHIGYYGDKKYEYTISIIIPPDLPPESVIDKTTGLVKIPVTDIDDGFGNKMQIYDRYGNPIYYIYIPEDEKELEVTKAVVIDSNKKIHIVSVIDDNGKNTTDKGTQKVSYFFESAIESLADNTFVIEEGDVSQEERLLISELFESWSKEEDDRYVKYPEDDDEYEEQYWNSSETFPGMDKYEPTLTPDGSKVFPTIAHGYKFKKGDPKQVRQGGIFERYTQDDIDAELDRAKEEAAKTGKNIDIIENAYAKLVPGDFKNWNNITSKNEKDYWAQYMALMALTTDSVKGTTPIEGNMEQMHFYKIHSAYIKCMAKILINLGFAEWSASPDKKNDYTKDKNYVIETDLDQFASIPLEDVKETLETVINNADDLMRNLDKCLKGYSGYPGEAFPGFETQYQEVQDLFWSLNSFAEYYWGAYRNQEGFNINTELSELYIPVKVRKANKKERQNSTAKYYPNPKKNGSGEFLWNQVKNWEYNKAMFLYYIMMYQAKLFYAINIKTIIDIIKQLQEYLSFDQKEYEKFMKNSAFTTKVRKGEEANDVMVEDSKGKRYARKTDAFRKVNKKLKKLFKKHFITYYQLMLDLFSLDDYVTDKFMIAFNKAFKKQIVEYEHVPEKLVITDKKTINYYSGDRSSDYARNRNF